MPTPIVVSDDLIRATAYDLEEAVGRQAAALEAFVRGFDLAREMDVATVVVLRHRVDGLRSDPRALEMPDVEIVSEVPFVVPR